MSLFNKISYTYLGDHMNIKEQIKNYIPQNMQEESDKKVILTYLNTFNNCFDRENSLGHFTASCWIINKEKTKVLMAYHNIYKSFAWLGGHADGNENLLEVALLEAKEESGIKNIKIIDNNIFSLDVIEVTGHTKKGKYITPHVHLNITYFFEGDENDILYIKDDENSDVKWINITDIDKLVTEEHMLYYYHKFIERAKNRN